MPQQHATQAGHDDVVALLLKAARQRAVDEPVDPARFLSAAALGDDLAVRDLLDRGADPDVRDSFGRTALHRAAFYGHRTTCALLLEAGTGLDRKDRWGRTPMHWAAAAAHMEIVDLLLDAGASADVPDAMDRTAPAIAAERGFVDIAARLSDEAPDRFKPSGLYQRVKRAVDAGQGYYFWSCQRLLEHTDKVRFPQRRDSGGRLQSPIPDYSVLHRAALENDPAAARLVLDNGGEVDRTCRRTREDPPGRSSHLPSRSWRCEEPERSS